MASDLDTHSTEIQRRYQTICPGSDVIDPSVRFNSPDAKSTDPGTPGCQQMMAYDIMIRAANLGFMVKMTTMYYIDPGIT